MNIFIKFFCIFLLFSFKKMILFRKIKVALFNCYVSRNNWYNCEVLKKQKRESCNDGVLFFYTVLFSQGYF